MRKRIYRRPLLTGALAATTALCLFKGASAHQAAQQTGKGNKPPTSTTTTPTKPTKSDPGSAQSASANPTAAKADQSGAALDKLHFTHWTTDEQTGITNGTLFQLVQEDMVVTGNAAHFNEKTDTLDCEGSIVMDDTKHHMTCEKVHMDHVEKKRKLRLVTFTGHVVMVMKPDTQPGAPDSKPAAAVGAPAASTDAKLPATPAPPAGGPPATPDKPSPDEDSERKQQEKRRGGTATCDHLDYRYAEKYSILTGHVVFTQRFVDKDGKQVERTLTCDHAEYDSKADKLHLFKPVHFADNQDRDLKTDEDVFIGTKEGAETTELGPGVLIFPKQSDDEDDDNPDTKASKTTPKQPDKTTKPPK